MKPWYDRLAYKISFALDFHWAAYVEPNLLAAKVGTCANTKVPPSLIHVLAYPPRHFRLHRELLDERQVSSTGKDDQSATVLPRLRSEDCRRDWLDGVVRQEQQREREDRVREGQGRDARAGVHEHLVCSCRWARHRRGSGVVLDCTCLLYTRYRWYRPQMPTFWVGLPKRPATSEPTPCHVT